MRERLIPLMTMLTAGTVTSLVCIWKEFDTLYSLKVLLGVLICFYLIGLLAKRLLFKVVNGPSIAEENVDETQEEGSEADEEQDNL